MNRPGTFSTHRVVSTKRTPSDAALRAVLAGLVLVLASAGCFYLGRDDYDEILQKPFKEWTPRDDLTVIIARQPCILIAKQLKQYEEQLCDCPAAQPATPVPA